MVPSFGVHIPSGWGGQGSCACLMLACCGGVHDAGRVPFGSMSVAPATPAGLAFQCLDAWLWESALACKDQGSWCCSCSWHCKGQRRPGYQPARECLSELLGKGKTKTTTQRKGYASEMGLHHPPAARRAVLQAVGQHSPSSSSLTGGHPALPQPTLCLVLH